MFPAETHLLEARPRSAEACPRCESESYATLFQAGDRLYHTTRKRFYLVECRDCGLIRLYPRPTEKELEEFYPDHYWWQADGSARGRLSEIYRRFVLRDHVRFVCAGLPHPAAVLDVGCGPGTFLAAMRARGHTVYGLDGSVQAARAAWKQYQVPVITASLPHHPFRGVLFGAITLFHVVEHFPDPEACLQAAADLLAPGGRMFIQVPNSACWQFLIFGARWNGLQVPRHPIHYRPEDLDDLLDHCGLRAVRRKFFSLRDNPAGLATSLAPNLEPVSRQIRRVREGVLTRLLKDCLYLGLTAAALPFTLLEAAASAGSTVMVEAVRKEEG